MQTVHTLLKLAQIRWTDHVTSMPDERLSKTVSMENFWKESALIAVKRNSTKTPFKPRWRISIFKLSLGNKLHRIEQSGVASSIKEQLSMKQSEAVKLKERTKGAKQDPTDHHQSQSLYSSLVVRKPVFGVSDQVRHKPGCTATEDG